MSGIRIVVDTDHGENVDLELGWEGNVSDPLAGLPAALERVTAMVRRAYGIEP